MSSLRGASTARGPLTSHNAVLHLVAPDGKFIAPLPANSTASTLAADITHFIKRAGVGASRKLPFPRQQPIRQVISAKVLYAVAARASRFYLNATTGPSIAMLAWSPTRNDASVVARAMSRSPDTWRPIDISWP